MNMDADKSKNVTKDLPTKKKRLPVSLLICIDVLGSAVILLLFYLMTYMWHGETEPKPLATPTVTPAVSDAALPTAAREETDATAATSPTASAEPKTLREKFADHFTDGAVEQTDNSYKNANISVEIDTVEDDGVVYYLADVYVADIKYFKTAFAKKNETMGYVEATDTVANEVGAIFAVNGDYCLNNGELIIRNGNHYDADSKLGADVLIMYNDGSMETLSPGDTSIDAITALSPYQVWTFGPMLLKDGQAMTEFNAPSQISNEANNPRTAIGYYEPGHYCFLVVDGRQKGYSYPGYTCAQMSELFYNLGCTAAYNLDGGKTSEMAFLGELYNTPAGGGREVSDIIYIADK